MKAKKKKAVDTSKYPQFAFRVPLDDESQKMWKRIKKNIDRLYDYYRKRKADDEFVIKKNEIILNALDRGLEAEIKKTFK